MGGLLTLAFAAGMVAPVNPCGFALLPAWITHTLGDADASPFPVRLLRALRAGLALAVGFAGTLAVAGLAVSAGARGLIRAAPWLGLAVGVLLVLLGLWMLAGRAITLRVPRISSRATAGLPPTARMVGFGVGYALASLSCTFGVILAVIAQAQATASYAGLLLVFGVYAAGSAAVLLLLALATAAAGSAVTRHVGRLARHGPRVTAVVLLLTGTYLAWYWYPAATSDAPTTAGRAGGLPGLSATVSGWIQGRTTLLGAFAAAAALLVLTLGVARRRRRVRSQVVTASCSDTADGTTPHPPSQRAAATSRPEDE
jgi:cytochrome c biogenesis protein CcdA